MAVRVVSLVTSSLPSLPSQSRSATLQLGPGKLDIASDILVRLKDVSKLAPLPYLEGIVGLVSTILEMLQAMRGNRKVRTELLQQIEMIGEIMRPFAAYRIADDNIVERLNNALEDGKSTLSKISAYGPIRSFFASPSIKNELIDLRTKFETERNNCQLALTAAIGVNQWKADVEIPVVNPYTINILKRVSSGNLKVVKVDGRESGYMKEYDSDEKFMIEKAIFEKLRELRSSSFLQVCGQSPPGLKPQFLLLRDPGAPSVLYFEDITKGGDPKSNSLNIIRVIKDLNDAMIHLLKQGSGGCLFETADIYINTMGCPVAADFEPSAAYDEDISDKQQVDVLWYSFARMVFKTLTGDRLRPNYACGQSARTNGLVIRAVQHIMHFVWNFRAIYNTSAPSDPKVEPPIIRMMSQFSSFLDYLQNDISTMDPTTALGGGYILPALLKRCLSSHCGIWNSWNAFDAEAGDIGYMTPGPDDTQPIFHKVDNVVVQITTSDKLIQLYADIIFHPKEDCWQSETLPGGVIRYKLDLSHCSGQNGHMFCIQRDVASSVVNKQFEFSAAWGWLQANEAYMEDLAQEHKVDLHDLMLVASLRRLSSYAYIKLAKNISTAERDKLFANAGFQDGLVYYFETPDRDVQEKQLHGYWSTKSEPGHPLWPPSPDAEGPEWAWEMTGDVNIEVSRKGPKQHIRYLHL